MCTGLPASLSTVEEKLPLGRVTKSGTPGKRRPAGQEVGFVAYRVNPVNKARFNTVCERLNLVGSEVIDGFMAEFGQKYSGEKGSIREEHEALQREANKLYDSLPGIRKPIVHWALFKKLYMELG